MRDNRVRPTRYGQFKKELVAGVRQERPQPEVNIGLAAKKQKALTMASIVSSGILVSFD
jgi:hypothetical protein